MHIQGAECERVSSSTTAVGHSRRHARVSTRPYIISDANQFGGGHRGCHSPASKRAWRKLPKSTVFLHPCVCVCVCVRVCICTHASGGRCQSLFAVVAVVASLINTVALPL